MTCMASSFLPAAYNATPNPWCTRALFGLVYTSAAICPNKSVNKNVKWKRVLVQT